MTRPSTIIILNKAGPSKIVVDKPIDVALALAMADLKLQFIDMESGVVRYKAIRNSEVFGRYKNLTFHLRSFDLRSLESRNQRLAFWINIYNTGVIQGVIELGLERSVKEFPRFFDRLVYEVGGYRFSLNQIEHGILRGNRRPPYGLLRPFRKGDPRMEFVASPMDLRIHFALVCGARSCPAIDFYEADQIDFQLDLAARSFINSPQVKILPDSTAISLSMVFKWYRSDFGGRERLLDTLLEFLDEGKEKEFLKQHRDRIRIRYRPYDWSLNA